MEIGNLFACILYKRSGCMVEIGVQANGEVAKITERLYGGTNAGESVEQIIVSGIEALGEIYRTICDCG